MFLQQFATVSMACMQEIISETCSYETMLKKIDGPCLSFIGCTTTFNCFLPPSVSPDSRDNVYEDEFHVQLQTQD